MRIILIRHGETAGNREHRYVGRTDEPVTAEYAAYLKSRSGVYPAADVVFSSPLRRCIMTAEILYPEISPQIVRDLQECDFGEFEYGNYKELSGNPDYQEWIDSNGTIGFPGGENLECFQNRCCSAFVRCVEKLQESNLEKAAFTVHGGTIMAVMDRFAMPHRPYFEWQVKNGQGYSAELKWNTEKDGDTLLLTDIQEIPEKE